MPHHVFVFVFFCCCCFQVLLLLGTHPLGTLCPTLHGHVEVRGPSPQVVPGWEYDPKVASQCEFMFPGKKVAGIQNNQRDTEFDQWERRIFLSLFFFFFFFFLLVRATPWLGVESELQLPTYTTATAIRDPSHICNLHHSSRQSRMANPLCEARDQTHILMDPSWIHFHCSATGTPGLFYLGLEVSKLKWGL